MKYRAYPEFIDYLFSEDSKEACYGDLRAWLTKRGDYERFEPSDSTSYPQSDVAGDLLSESDFDYQSTRMDSRPRTSDSNALTSETDFTYEEVFNIPAKTLLADHPELRTSYVNQVIRKAKLNEIVNPKLVSEEETTDIDYLNREIPLSSEYSEYEYDMLGIPHTYLNDSPVSVRADDLVSSGARIQLANGCLIGVSKNDQLYPIGFIDFQGVMPCTRYEVKFDPQGFLQLM